MSFFFFFPSARSAEGKEVVGTEIDRAHALSCIMSPPSGLGITPKDREEGTKRQKNILTY